MSDAMRVSVVADIKPFQVELSVEKERAAHATLLLRTFLRQFGDQFPPEYYTYLKKGLTEPNWQALYPDQWEAAKKHALLLELGLPETELLLFKRIAEGRAAKKTCMARWSSEGCRAYLRSSE